jgi:Sec-independent protein translocase protein TatA
MFSWGEIFVVTGLSIALIGRHDLPKAAYYIGQQTGRLVGVLQGARVRMNQYTNAQSDLTQLRAEVQSGLRELDHVRAELLTSLSTRNIIGRDSVSTVSNAVTTTTATAAPGVSSLQQQPIQNPYSNTKLLPLPTNASSSLSNSPSFIYPSSHQSLPSNGNIRSSPLSLSSSNKNQRIGAIAEDVWLEQGIAFQSRAERGVGVAGWSVTNKINNNEHWPYESTNSNTSSTTFGSAGSYLLTKIHQEILIHDQHDHVIYEQDNAVQSRVAEALRQSEKHSK